MFDQRKDPEDIFEALEAEVPTPRPPVQLGPSPVGALRAPAPANLPTEAEGGSVGQPTEASATLIKQKRRVFFPWKPAAMVAIVLVLFVAAGLGVRVLFSSSPISPAVLSSEQGREDADQIPEGLEQTTDPKEKEETNTVSLPTPPVAVEPDADKDGLSNEQEAKLGTDGKKADTDGDGLFDREEVSVYRTNPLLKDTDGDGYEDGTEIANGFNPNGSGTLIPTQPNP